jgi:TIR domain
VGAVNAPGKAVFLSYASQDTEAARHLCNALAGAGIEVWFDQSELRGGEAWDALIRRQIRDCGLFVALVSANTNARG